MAQILNFVDFKKSSLEESEKLKFENVCIEMYSLNDALTMMENRISMVTGDEE